MARSTTGFHLGLWGFASIMQACYALDESSLVPRLGCRKIRPNFPCASSLELTCITERVRLGAVAGPLQNYRLTEPVWQSLVFNFLLHATRVRLNAYKAALYMSHMWPSHYHQRPGKFGRELQH